MFINSTNHSGGAFRTKRQLIAVHGVGEAVHLLFNDVRYLADAAGKNARIFKNRRTDFLITVGRQHVDAGLLHVLPDGASCGSMSFMPLTPVNFSLAICSVAAWYV